jgi:hypothetical protein
VTRTQICLGTDGIEPSFGVVSEDLCMRIVILFPIASFYVSRSRETNRQSSARVKARSPTPRDTTLWSRARPPQAPHGARDGPRSGSSFTVLRAVWRGERRARAGGRPNPQQRGASRLSVFDRCHCCSPT